jgi:hypothetical protein
MKTLIIAILTLVSTTLFAQNTVTWKGGTPGKETQWNESKNWSDNQVPDENTNVIIKFMNTGHFAQPVVEESVEVGSIELHAGANLTITESGEVLVDGSDFYTIGIVSFGGTLINQGVISLINIDNFSEEKFREIHSGNGTVLLDNNSINAKYYAKK